MSGLEAKESISGGDLGLPFFAALMGNDIPFKMGFVRVFED
jgi:hypothetical protein